MRKHIAKQVTIDPEAWARNLRIAADAPPDDDAPQRCINNYFAFWAICPTGVCKRNKRCAGDSQACHDRIWPHVPERMKFEFRGYIKAADDGLSGEEAVRKVKADWERMEALARELGKGPAAERVDPAAKPAQREDAVRAGDAAAAARASARAAGEDAMRAFFFPLSQREANVPAAHPGGIGILPRSVKEPLHNTSR